MTPLYWSLLLLIITLLVLVLELFLPSGGMLGFLAAACCVASILMAFQAGPSTGLAMLLVASLVVPVVIMLAIQVWPHTPLGRRVIQARPQPEDVLPERPNLRRLIGRRGVVKSKMLPGGIVQIDGEHYDAITQGMGAEPGEPVEVVDLETNRLVVRVATPLPSTTDHVGATRGSDHGLAEPSPVKQHAAQIPEGQSPPDPSPTPDGETLRAELTDAKLDQSLAENLAEDIDDVLSRPIDQLGLESLDEPLR